LKVSPEYLLTVDGQTTTWENGKCLIFDDSYLHSVKHEANKNSEQEDRVVLIIDLWHPDLSEEERDAINLCFHP
jgi:aspartyl/asparaginyl beta-hydroxylase (cupin superfamily)